MGAIVVGSTALKHWFPTKVREPKDYDVFSDCELPGADVFWDDRFAGWVPEGEIRYATPDELLSLKLSHTAWELPRTHSWEKHMSDIVFLQSHGAAVRDDLYDMLYSVWLDKHGRKPIMLSDDKSEFFDDAVKRKYDHDSLHRSVAYFPGYPLYENYLKPSATVEMDMDLVWSDHHDAIVNLFREEVYVTALERKVIPSGYTVSPRLAYGWALRRTITGLTKGRSSRFMRENFTEFRSPDSDYVARHLENSHYLEELT